MSRLGFRLAQDQLHKDIIQDIQERKSLPYTVTMVDSPGHAKRFNAEADIRSAHKAFTRREKAISAFNSGSGDVRDVGAFKLIETPKARQHSSGYVVVPDTHPCLAKNNKIPLVTRIYNWFLNINY